MKIYFEDGVLTATQSLQLGCDHIINASTGYSNNERVLDRIMKEKPNASIYTNSVVPLIDSAIYCWDDNAKVFELYIRDNKTNEFLRVDKLTNRELRFGHNLMKMYRSGEFERR